MTVRNITGNLVDITGEILPNTDFTVIPETYVFGAGTDTVVFGDTLTVNSNEVGEVDFDLYEGRYVGRISTNRGTKDFRLVVDSEGPWNLARLVGTIGDITPGIISQAFEAVAQAGGFANQAEQFAELAGENSRLEVGTVTTGAPGDPAEATIVGVPGEQLLNLVIPKGDPGQSAENGLVFEDIESVEFTVGVGGDFGTINEAINAASKVRLTHKSPPIFATIRLLSDFVMQEQVLVYGQDLSWITILSDDAVVTIDHNAITSNDLSPLDDARPAFGAVNGGALPAIGALFSYADNSTSWDGIAVYGGSSVEIKPECGIRKCRRGIQVYNASRVYCNIDGLRSSGGSATSKLGVDFRDCSGRALDVQQGSFAHLPRSNFNDAGGDPAVYFIWGSYGNIYQSSVRRAAGTAILARDGSVLCARECDMDQAGNRAVHALHGALIDARHSPSSGFGTFGATNCNGTIAVLASAASIIEAESLPVSGASGRGFSAGDGSTINAQFADAQGCGTIGMIAERGSTINANDSNVSGCPTGYQATNASIINARDGTANNCTGFGVLAESGSRINAQSVSATGCDRAVEVREGSSINARNATLTNSVSRAISVIDGGDVNCQDANTAGASSFHLTVRGGGRASAASFNGSIDLRTGGGIVHNSGGTGSVSHSVNTLSAQGIIFR